ncbi:MAG: hypothetical protein R3A51_15250 [Nannocystaceae bacterium]
MRAPSRTLPTSSAAALGLGLAVSLLGLASAGIDGAHAPALTLEAPRDHAASDGRYRVRVEPPEERARVEVSVDGAPRSDGPDHDGHLELALAGPGLRRVAVVSRRRGDRQSAIVDGVLVGPFATRDAARERCGLSLQISARALERIAVPALRERLLAVARQNPLLGEDAVVERLELRLLPGAARFEVALAGAHRIATAGVIDIRSRGERALDLRLRSLGEVVFTGTLRDQARYGGAAVGAVITGPLAPLGAVAGYVIVDRYIDDRAREELETRLTAALAEVSGVALLPEAASLAGDDPRARVGLALCEPVVVDPSLGVIATLRLAPAAARDDLPLATPGPVDLGVALPPAAPLAGEDVRVDLSLDAVNALLDAWTRSGLLGELTHDHGLLDRARAGLGEWTTLELRELIPRLPPVVGLPDDDAPAGALSVGLGGVELAVDGVDPRFSAVVVGGQGHVWPEVDGGVIALRARVDQLWLTCERDDGRAGVTLDPCFGALLTHSTVAEQLNVRLSEESGRLPSLDAAALLRERTAAVREGGLHLAELAVTRPNGAPGILRLSARVE